MDEILDAAGLPPTFLLDAHRSACQPSAGQIALLAEALELTPSALLAHAQEIQRPWDSLVEDLQPKNEAEQELTLHKLALILTNPAKRALLVAAARIGEFSSADLTKLVVDDIDHASRHLEALHEAGTLRLVQAIPQDGPATRILRVYVIAPGPRAMLLAAERYGLTRQ